MSFVYDVIWPMRIDLSELECRQILREKELVCFSDVVSVLRAQGPPSEEKSNIIYNLQKILSIDDDRTKTEFRIAANNEKLATIAEVVSGYDGYKEWADMGAIKFPPTKRPPVKIIMFDQASQTELSQIMKEKNTLDPAESANYDIMNKHEAAILANRIGNKDKRCSKIEYANKGINTPNPPESKIPNQELFKYSKIKESATSQDYNLHLLSEIATGESSQSDNIDANSTPVNIANIKADSFSIRNQINDIEDLPTSDLISTSSVSHQAGVARGVPTSNIILPVSNVVIGKSLSGNQDNQQLNISSSMPVVINNSQRFVLPRNSTNQSINLIASNQSKNQHHSIASYLTPQHQNQQTSTGSTFLTLTNPLRSPTNQQIVSSASSWNTQQQPPQVYISNVTTHGMGIPQHSSMENLTSLGYTLQQRAVREQHQSNNKPNFIVRNLGSHPGTNPETERNKRFMVLKGNSSVGPSSKKTKMSNPSNRQPGRPPLMPAPNSTYTSRPYIANEIFNSGRSSSTNAISNITDSSTGSSSGAGDTANGVRISSVTSRATSALVGQSGSAANLTHSKTSSAAFQHHSLNRATVSVGNGVQRLNSSSVSHNTSSGGGGNSISHGQPLTTVQVGTGSAKSSTMSGGHGANSASDILQAVNISKQKSIQPVISVVPLSSVSQSSTATITSSLHLNTSNPRKMSNSNVATINTSSSLSGVTLVATGTNMTTTLLSSSLAPTGSVSAAVAIGSGLDGPAATVTAANLNLIDLKESSSNIINKLKDESYGNLIEKASAASLMGVSSNTEGITKNQ